MRVILREEDLKVLCQKSGSVSFNVSPYDVKLNSSDIRVLLQRYYNKFAKAIVKDPQFRASMVMSLAEYFGGD